MNIWLFDIDGVLTDLKSRKLSQPLLDFIAQRNRQKEPVAFVTGRSLDWIQERLFPILNRDGDIDYSLIVSSCEKSGVFVTFDQKSKPQVEINESLKVPQDVQDKAAEVASQFPKVMFFDPKLTMATMEAREDVPNQLFREDQKIYDQKLNDYIEEKGYKDLKLDSADISTDVESINVSKRIGLIKILNWLKEKSIRIDHIYAFGDRESDLEIGDYLHESNQPATVVFSGEKDLIKRDNLPFEIIFTNKLYSEGTLEFLSSLKLDPNS